jgi:hypothetical protein
MMQRFKENAIKNNEPLTYPSNSLIIAPNDYHIGIKMILKSLLVLKTQRFLKWALEKYRRKYDKMYS